MTDVQPPVLARYFALLDARRIEELVALFAPDGCMITRGGTGGEPVRGHEALRRFYAGRGPAVSEHIIAGVVQGPALCLAEGLVRPLVNGGTKFFIASAVLDRDGLITRYTTLVWDGLTPMQERSLVAAP